MIRDLIEAGIGLVKQEMREQVQAKAKDRVTERLLDMLVPRPKNSEPLGARAGEGGARTPAAIAREDEGQTGSRRTRRPRGRADRRAEGRAGADLLQHGHGEHGHGPPEHVRQDHAAIRSTAATADQGGPEGPHGAGDGSPDRPRRDERTGGRPRREPGDRLPRRDRQGLRAAVIARARTSPARACSATCCRSSRGRR